MPFYVPILLAVAVIALLSFVRGRAAVVLCTIAAAALPPILLGVALQRDAPSFGDIRLRLNALVFADRELAERPASIGGEIARDDLVVPGLPGGLLKLHGAGVLTSDPTRPNRTRPAPPNWSEAGIVSIKRNDMEQFLGAHRVRPGDRLCLERCDTAAARWLKLDGGGRRLAWTDRANETLPAFRDRFWTPYKPAQAIYPLRDYARPANPGAVMDDDPCVSRFHCVGVVPRPARSFLFRNDSGDLEVALLDPGAVLQVERAGETIAIRAAPVQDSLAAKGKPAVQEITLWQVRYADATFDFTSQDRASALIRRRILIPTTVPDGIRLTLKVKPVHVITLDEIKRMRAGQQREQIVSPVAIALRGMQAPGETAFTGNMLALDPVGGAIAEAIAPDTGSFSSLVFASEFLDRTAPANLLPTIPGAIAGATGRDADQPGAADSFAIGASDTGGVRRAIELKVDRLVYPEVVIPIVLSWALLFFWTQLVGWRERNSALILCLGLQIMLLMRIFVVIGSAALDPQIDFAVELATALIAYCALPCLLAAVFARSDTHPALLWIPGLAVLLLALLFSWHGQATRIAQGVAGTTFLCCLLRPLAARYWPTARDPVRNRIRKVQAAAASSWGSLRGQIGDPRVRLPRRVKTGLAFVRRHLTPPASAQPWVKLATWLTAIRLALFILFGIRERYFIAVSAVYVPLMLLCAAGLLVALRRAGDARSARLRAAWFLAVIAIVGALVPMAVADNGFVLCFLPAILLVAATYAPPILTGLWQRATIVAPAAIVILALFASVTVASLVGQQADVKSSSTGGQLTSADAGEALTRYATRSQNEWRFLTIYSPGALDAAGSVGAEQMRRWRYLLGSFTRSDSGAGLGYRAQLSDLRAVQADDNVSAIHLMAPFGRHGAAALLLLIGVMAWGAVRASPAPMGVRRTWGILAVWTLFAVDAYMILANLVLVPFTGRNVYLMAAYSHSDLIEGAALFAIAMGGLALPRLGEAADGL